MPRVGLGNFWTVSAGFGLVATGFCSLGGTPVLAQVVPDGTLGEGEASRVRSGEVNNLPADVIEGGAARGTNLFHSFEAFNVGAGQRLYFANPAGIANILGRVTGNNVSNINGELGVDGVANLYLLNPNGIVFGPNAQLDIRGSFTASTAESLEFVDGSVFSADGSAIPSQLLTLSIAPGVQYGSQDASITNQGSLVVGQDLTLGAQRLELAGQLEAGRDIVLQGGIRQLSNASYTVGGYLFTQDLTGQGVEFVNPHSNVIIANGDVRFNAGYSGPSLRVLAGGQVTQASEAGAITITGPDGGSTTETVQDGLGGVQIITVDAVDEPTIDKSTIDIRSNVNWQQVMRGLPGNENRTTLSVTFGDGVDLNAVSEGGITLGNLTSSGGNINLAAVNAITTGRLDSSTTSNSGDSGPGGSISISSRSGNVTTGSVISASNSSLPRGGNSSSGGTISISTHTGNITTNGVLSSESNSSPGNSNLGGSISISTYSGSITTNSYVGSVSRSGGFTAGSGGSVLISSYSGDISIKDLLESSSESVSDGGSGGDISIISYSGNITVASGLNSRAFTRSGDTGTGGAISISSHSGDVTLDADVFSTSSSISGNPSSGGAISISSHSGEVVVNNKLSSISFSEVGTASVGGNISISSHADDVTVASLDSSSFSDSGTAGIGGDISIFSGSGSITLIENQHPNEPDGSEIADSRLQPYSYSVSGNAGTSGNITLSAPGGSIFGTNTQLAAVAVVDVGKGGGSSDAGGSITLQARDTISGLEVITVSFAGDSGSVEIQGSGDLRIQDTNLTTSTQIITLSPYGGAPIRLDINQRDASGNIYERGQAGNTSIASIGSITFDNVQILSNAYGANPAGGVTIESPSGVTFQNNSQININTNNTARAGNLNLQTPAVVFNDSDSRLSAETTSSGSAGNITLQPYPGGQTIAVTFAEGARITASTTGTSTGQGGSVTLTAPDSVTIQGRGRISSETSGSGSAGNLNITTGDLTIQDGATLSVSSSTIAPTANPALAADTTPGNAGNINLNTRSLRLNNQASLQAVTASGEGGNINLAATDVLALRRNSFISTEAGGSGNGGNINANAGFVVTVPNENNDIIANAFSGSGGQVNLTAQRILGFAPQSGFTTTQLRSNISSDLSASSQDGPQGTVAVSNLAIDPSQALAELPVTFSDVTNQIAQGCRVNPATAQSQFVITGRGGLPPSPSDPLASEPSDFPWATRELSSPAAESTATLPEVSLASPALVEAQGWVREANGDIVFVVAPPTASQPSTDRAVASVCPGPTVLE